PPPLHSFPTRRSSDLRQTTMRRLTERTMNTTLITFLLSSSIAFAQASKPPDPGWVPLFNGKDLTGWVKVGNEKWEVQDGTIHGRSEEHTSELQSRFDL